MLSVVNIYEFLIKLVREKHHIMLIKFAKNKAKIVVIPVLKTGYAQVSCTGSVFMF